MVDGIKLLIKNQDFAAQLLQNPNFEFVFKVSDSTAEIKDGKEAKYKGLTIRVFNSGLVLISGSLHKFKNNGFHNYDNFYLSEVIEVINQWQKIFCFDLTAVKIENLEIGVNITPPIPTKEILKNIVSHRREPFKHISHPNSDYKECVHQHFIIKTYDKAKQYNQNSQILRIEAKFIKMAELNSIGIKNLSDLLYPEIYAKLRQILKDTWSEVLYIDTTVNVEKLTPKQRESYKDWVNINYWHGLTEHPIKKKFNTEKDRYQRILKEHSENIQAQILKRISEKWEKISNISEIVLKENREKLPDNFRVEKHELGKNTPLYNEVLIPNNEKRLWTSPKLYLVCPVTKLKIYNQKTGSKFLSISGIKYLLETDKPKFEQLKKERLTHKWLNEPLEVQIREIAHSIRNEYYNPKNNPRNNTRRAINNIFSYPVLFDTCTYIRPDKKEIAQYECN